MPSSDVVAPAPDALRLTGTLLLLVRAIDQWVRAAERSISLTMPELQVLGQVDRGVDMPSQIARALRLDPARVTHVTDRLVALSLLTREPDLADRRCWRLRLTAAGTARLAEGRADITAAMETLLDGLAPEERAGLAQGLDGVRRVLTAVAPAPPPPGV